MLKAVSPLLLLLLAACAQSGSDDYPAAGRQHLRGFFASGNELQAFQLCGSSILIWVDRQESELGREKLQAIQEPSCDGGTTCPPRFGYVEIDALVSGPCQCGHASKFQRMLTVKEWLAASLTPPPDCPHAEPRYPQ